jgi:hypothetical protein
MGQLAVPAACIEFYKRWYQAYAERLPGSPLPRDTSATPPPPWRRSWDTCTGQQHPAPPAAPSESPGAIWWSDRLGDHFYANYGQFYTVRGNCPCVFYDDAELWVPAPSATPRVQHFTVWANDTFDTRSYACDRDPHPAEVPCSHCQADSPNQLIERAGGLLTEALRLLSHASLSQRSTDYCDDPANGDAG